MNKKTKEWFPLLTLCSALCLANTSSAQTLYWDNNGASAGFGTATGTWAAPTTNDATQGWSTSSAGTTALSGTTTTTTSNALNFGTSTAGLATGTITVSGNVNSGAMTFGSASGNITLDGGTITLGGNILPSGNTSATHTITSDIVLTGARTIGLHAENRFILSGVISGNFGLTTVATGGFVQLDGMNTFTGNYAHQRGQFTFNSIADAGQDSALGKGSQITIGLNGAQAITALYTGTESASSDKTWNNAANTATIIAQNGSLNLTGNISSGVNSGVRLSGTADTGINQISGVISAAGSLSVGTSGAWGAGGEAGFWILSGNNSYQGATTVEGGSRLRIAHANALGTTAAGTTVANGGVLELAGGISVGAEALSLQGTGISLGGALRNISGDNSYAGTIALAAAARINSDAGTMTLANITNSQNLTFGGAGNTTVSGNITTGTGTLTKIDAGTLTLAGANTYTGNTTINGGTLRIDGAGRLGGGSYAGTISITNSSTFSYNGTNSQTLSGIISGSGALTKSGESTLTLTAGNTFSGVTTVNQGTLQIGNGSNTTADVAGTTILSGGNLSYNYNAADYSVNGNITLTTNATISRLSTHQMDFGTGTLNGNGHTLNVEAEGSGTLYFKQAAGTSLGHINILKGSVGMQPASAMPLQNASMNIANGAQFTTWAGTATGYTLNNNITLNGGAGPNGNGALVNGASSSITTYSGTITLADATDSTIGTGTPGMIFSGQVVGGGSLTKSGASTLTMIGNNTYTGNTTISAGTLQINGAGRLGGGNYAGNIANSGTFLYNGTNSQELSGIISGTGALTKTGVGTLTLSGANSYSGATTISAGTLIVDGSIAAGSSLIVDSGATLGGSGTISGNATVNGNLQPGNSPGLLTFDGDLTLGETAITTMEINGLTRGTNYDAINVGGALTYGGSLVLNFGTTFGEGNYKFNLFDFAGNSGNFNGGITLGGEYAGTFTGDGDLYWRLVDGDATWTYTLSTGDLDLNVIPEPSTYALLALAAAGLGAHVIRRRRKK